MGVTYTAAGARSTRRALPAGVMLGPVDLRLAAISLLAAVAVALTATAKLRTVDAATVDLNRVRDASALEAPLAPVFEDETERRFAARELFAFLSSRSPAAIPNVGTLGRARVRTDLVARDDRLPHYRARVQAARANGATPASIPLLTAADLAGIKPALAVRSATAFRQAVFWWTLLYLAAFQAASALWWWQRRRGDRVLLAAAHLLTAVGLCAMISRPDPLRDWLLFPRFAQTAAAGALIMAIVAAVDLRTPRFRQLVYTPLLAAFALSMTLLVFGSGPGESSARVNLGPVQPIETIRLLVVFFLAAYFARRWELLRQLRQTSVRGRAVPRWLSLPRADYVLPVIGGVAAALGLLFLQRDLGPALILGLLFLALYGLARARIGMPLAGLALLLAGFYVSYRIHIPATVVDRVRIWQSPWNNAVRGGDQIADAIWTLASGGSIGTGLGLGATRYLPAGHTDLVLAAIGEELGFFGIAIVAALYVAIATRAIRVARRASTDYELFLACGLTLLLIAPVVLIASATVGVAPLTGVVTPFLSYGGSAMIANFAALGLLASIRSHASGGETLQAFDRPLAWLSGAVALAALPALLVFANIQLRRADDYAIRPHLGLQADGSRRFAYNPRILDLLDEIPRGSVVDRGGLVLATDDVPLAARSAAAYRHLGLGSDPSCEQPRNPRTATDKEAIARCYPLGGRAFDLLGDARTHLNWTASNTSFVERDDEAKLRGFDDHASAVSVSDGAGNTTWTIRRDFRAVLPLLRHEYDRDDPAVARLLRQPHDVRLTIDARLQVKVSDILAAAAARSHSGKAAAIVIDAQTGDVLASVSYPWPASTAAGIDDQRPDALLDRARYGLYPPGSTFKIVTAAAALQHDPASAHTTFRCGPLPGGRVGARIPGWPRPVRDDVRDVRAHGALDMHEAMVVSCNAYFAQLAVRIGPGALADAARTLNISLARNHSLSRIRQTLPQLGYGQGEVVVTPARMTQIAGAVASGGRLPDAGDEEGERAGTPWLPPSTARLLASYMRDVVLNGTGRALRGSPVPIAGKTGTAELTGAESHAWFVGFAPYGPSPRHIAFAVLIENGGYGARAAAPAAGQIVAAASALGLLQGDKP
ncbi:MAG TPA: FtsW/RodA/SpoVE family cell cycle protein [Vicinamibacterales bacterium]|nr:FtsW/RodA/SpoVE family cell cycle protein [Vicinamibacterales bacterium]